MSPAPPTPTACPPDPARNPCKLPAPLTPPSPPPSPARRAGVPHRGRAGHLSSTPSLGLHLGGSEGRKLVDIHPYPAAGLQGLPRVGDARSWFPSGLGGGRGGRGSCHRGCPQGPLPFPLSLTLASVWREGLALCPVWIAPEESQTQPKLWPRLPMLCQQDLELGHLSLL